MKWFAMAMVGFVGGAIFSYLSDTFICGAIAGTLVLMINQAIDRVSQ